MTVADSLAATAESDRQKKLAGLLARQARNAISDRALSLAEASDLPGFGDKIVAEWTDDANRLRRIVVTPHGRVLSYAYTGRRPSGRAHSIHRLTNVPLAHLEEHFGPLMTPDYATAAVQ